MTTAQKQLEYINDDNKAWLEGLHKLPGAPMPIEDLICSSLSWQLQQIALGCNIQPLHCCYGTISDIPINTYNMSITTVTHTSVRQCKHL